MCFAKTRYRDEVNRNTVALSPSLNGWFASSPRRSLVTVVSGSSVTRRYGLQPVQASLRPSVLLLSIRSAAPTGLARRFVRRFAWRATGQRSKGPSHLHRASASTRSDGVSGSSHSSKSPGPMMAACRWWMSASVGDATVVRMVEFSIGSRSLMPLPQRGGLHKPSPPEWRSCCRLSTPPGTRRRRRAPCPSQLLRSTPPPSSSRCRRALRLHRTVSRSHSTVPLLGLLVHESHPTAPSVIWTVTSVAYDATPLPCSPRPQTLGQRHIERIWPLHATW